jgi:hypothetical protein
MAIATYIRNTIQQLPEGTIFGYDTLRLETSQYLTAAKALERLHKQGIIKKVAKGMFYRPERTVFGELQPDYHALLQMYLFEQGKRIAYITGTALYNRLGLTTQMPVRIKIASRAKRIVINHGALRADAVKSYADVTDENYELLGLLDAFKDVKEIPDCSIEQAVERLRVMLFELSSEKQKECIDYALLYPPRVRALLGAMLEYGGYGANETNRLKESLNPFSVFKVGLTEDALPTKTLWSII